MTMPANDDAFDDEDDGDEFGELGDDARDTATGIARFAGMVRGVSWFAAVGEPVAVSEAEEAMAYAAALGFPDVHVAGVFDWDEAEAAIRNPDWNSAWWEAEEQARAALITDARERFSEHELMMALTRVTSAASDVVHGAAAVAAARGGMADQGLIRAAAGAATQACYQAALVLAAGGDEGHPFAIKFRLFEGGRWPLGIVGGTLNVF